MKDSTSSVARPVTANIVIIEGNLCFPDEGSGFRVEGTCSIVDPLSFQLFAR